MSGFALVLALLYTPYYLEVHVTYQAFQTGESNWIKKENNLKRILLGFCGFIFHLMVLVTVSYTGGNKGLLFNGCTKNCQPFYRECRKPCPTAPRHLRSLRQKPRRLQYAHITKSESSKSVKISITVMPRR